MPDPDNADAPFDLDATVAAVEHLRPVAPETARHADALAAEVRRLRAERDRLQRACDAGLPREVIPCPNCKLKHVEGPRHDNPALDGRTRPHHTHRCYHCGHVWDAGRWSFGVEEATGIAAELEAARADAAGLRAELNELRASMRPRPEECAVDIGAIEARANAASRGPWHTEEDVDGDDGPGMVFGPPREYVAETYTGTSSGGIVADAIAGGPAQQHANAAFVAHAREDVPALCAELRRFIGLHAAERAVRLSYEACISFETSCRGCAKALDAQRGAEERAERAEAALADLRAAEVALCDRAPDVLDGVTVAGMQAVMARRLWWRVRDRPMPGEPGRVVAHEYDHPEARCFDPRTKWLKTPVVPTECIADWRPRVVDWCEAVASRHGDVSPAQVLAEAIAASREASAPADPLEGP